PRGDGSEIFTGPFRELAGVPKEGESVMLPAFMDEKGNSRREPLLTRTAMAMASAVGGDPSAARENFAKGYKGAGLADLFTGGPELAAAGQVTHMIGEPKIPSPLETQPYQESAYNAINKANAIARDEKGNVGPTASTLPEIRNEAAKR